MTTRYPGGLIRKTPPTITPPVDGEGGSAPGVWTLEQASYYTKQGTWPKPIYLRPLYSWGDNAAGEIGDSTVITRSSPVQVGTLTTWEKLSSGSEFSFAIKQDGTLWSWGINTNGQLGQNDVVRRSSPVQVGVLTTWSKVSVQSSSCFAIKTDGTLWSWGLNTNGQLGQNDRVARSSPTQIGALNTWSSVSAGSDLSLATKTDGTLWSWGQDNQGQLGSNTANKDRSSPVQIGALTTWSSISAASTSGYAIQTDGTLWAWGRNQFGQLGINNATTKSSPTQIGALTNWLKVSGVLSFAIATKTDGTLWSWGQNDIGQLGQNNRVYKSSPTQIGSLTTWSNIAVSSIKFAITTKTDGTLWVWGKNDKGQLGKNDVIYRSSPVQVGSLTTWYQVSAGDNSMATLKTL